MLHHVQLWPNLFSPPVPCCVCVYLRYGGRVGGRLELSTHRAMQQLANKDEFCFVWQRFSVHYFPLCPARIPDLSSCLSCKDTLSGPDSSSHAHTHSTHGSYTLHLRSHPPLTVLHMWGAYVVICLTTTPLSTTLCTLRSFLIPSSSLISHLVSNQSCYSSVLPLIWLSSATCLLSHLTFIRKALIPGHRSFSGFPHSKVCLCVSAFTVRPDT